MQDLVHKYAVNPSELDYDAAMNTFKLGDAAFYFNGVWATGTLENQDGLNFAAAPLPPIMVEKLHGQVHTPWLSRYKKNQDPARVEAAMTFINWMTSHGELWAKAGHIPTRKSVAEKAEMQALPYRADYAAAAAFALPTPRTPAWEEIYGTLSDKLEYAVTKNQNPKAALADMEQTVKDIIASY